VPTTIDFIQLVTHLSQPHQVKHYDGIASLQLNPTAKIELAVSHVPKLIVSWAQYAIHVHNVHV